MIDYKEWTAQDEANAEEKLLGVMLVGGEGMARAVADCFGNADMRSVLQVSAHRNVYSAIVSVASRGELTIPAIVSEMEQAKTLDVGTMETLACAMQDAHLCPLCGGQPFDIAKALLNSAEMHNRLKYTIAD